MVSKDIPLMAKDATFSAMLKGITDFYLLKELPKVELRELPKQEEVEEEDFEALSLFE